jgi:hypothetical protein
MNLSPTADHLVVTDSVPIRGTPEAVYAHLWDAERWPALAPHVVGIEMLEQGPTYQHFRMKIASDGRMVVVETTRLGTPHRAIAYRQTRPPEFFREHEGIWEISDETGGVCVTLTHAVLIDDLKLRTYLKVESDNEARRQIRAVLSRNGLRTIEAIKRSIEGGDP